MLVIYNGVSRWTAARRVIDLVTPAASDDPEPDLSRTSPLFGGDGYVTVDSGRLGADDLLPDNAAALLAGPIGSGWLAGVSVHSVGRRSVRLAAPCVAATPGSTRALPMPGTIWIPDRYP